MFQSALCPSGDRLRELVLGLLPDDDTDAVANHLLHCGRCADTIAQLDLNDTLIDAMRQAPQVARRLPRGEFVDATAARAAQLVTSASLKVDDTSAEHPDTPSEAAADDSDTTEYRQLLAPPARPDELGRLGPYRVLRLLGAGGMGVVYLAEDEQLQRPVALKAMKPSLAAVPENRRRFLREARSAAALRDEHVVTIYQVGEDRHIPWLAMELLEGETLAQRLTREGRLPVRDAVQIARQVALGLAAAHRRHLVHRDVKPSNLMLVDEEPEVSQSRSRLPGGTFLPAAASQAALTEGPARQAGPTVKLLDFGLARAADDETNLTVSGAIVGTPAYMAPEQARGEPSDHRGDLFSLGCVLYHALAGRPPFRGKDTVSTLAALVTTDPPPLAEQRPDAPADLCALVHRLLAKNPADRPQTAAEVAAALAAIESKLTISSETNPPEPQSVNETQNELNATVTLRCSQVSITPRHAGAVTPTLPKFDPATRRHVRRTTSKWGGPAQIALALAAFGAVFLTCVLLTLRTPYGEVVVELGQGVAPDDVKIEIQGNGELKVADAKNGWAIDVREGKYNVQLAGSTDRFDIDQNTITVRRDKEARVRVTLKPATIAQVVVSVWKPTPEQQAFFDEVARMSADKQVAAVSKKLMEVNPGFDGALGPTLDDGKVVGLEVPVNEVTDIWPVRALAELDRLNVSSGALERYGKRSNLSNLSPLAGMQLTELTLHHLPALTDLSPLAGMPLTKFDCSYTGVQDLSPLKGMPLTLLFCNSSRVSGLLPLKGMHLTGLNLYDTPTTDRALEHLKDMTSLTGLNLGSTRTTDAGLAKLTGLIALESLWLQEAWQISDRGLEHIRELPKLTNLYLPSTTISDNGLERIKDMKQLKVLSLAWTQVSDSGLLQLKELSNLETLDLSHSNVSARGVAELHASCPKCKIIWDGGAIEPKAAAADPEIRPGVEDDWLEKVRALGALEQAAEVAAELQRRNPGFAGKLAYNLSEGKVVEWTITGGRLEDLSPLLALDGLKTMTYPDLRPWHDAPVLRRIASLETLNARSAADYRRLFPPRQTRARRGPEVDRRRSRHRQPRAAG